MLCCNFTKHWLDHSWSIACHSECHGIGSMWLYKKGFRGCSTGYFLELDVALGTLIVVEAEFVFTGAFETEGRPDRNIKRGKRHR